MRTTGLAGSERKNPTGIRRRDLRVASCSTCRPPLPGLLLLAAALLVLSSPSPLAAQQSPDAGAVTGTVTGQDADPVASANVRLTGSRLETMTGSDGGFTFLAVPAGPAVLEISLLGYHTATILIQIVPGGSITVDVDLEVDPLKLDALDGQALTRRTPELSGFYERRQRGRGHFFTRDEIRGMQSRLVTDVLRRVPGVRVEPLAGPMGTSYVVRMQRTSGVAGARGCPVQYYMNGVHFSVAQEIGINSYVRPDEIAGMEVYSGTSQLPPQFHASGRNARCGVIVIWTHAGERQQRQ
jgi:hypothetical protein